MKIVYAVKYIEVDFGQRDEGYALYLNEGTCINDIKSVSKRGAYSGGGGYYGPERPLSYIEVPFDSLSPKLKKELKASGMTHTENNWSPNFVGKTKSIL